MHTFHQLDLPAPLLKNLDISNFIHPTPIQSLAIPISLTGVDVMGSAQTGTGKTLAFVIPLLTHLLENPTGTALVLTPTRELAQQVLAAIKNLLGHTINEKVTLLIGGEHIGKQFKALRAHPRIVVGTPGRVNDHLSRKTLKTNRVSMLVLDETDRMFDMGFGIQLEEIISHLPEERQTLMYSATFPPKIEKLAATYMSNPQRIRTETAITISDNLQQETLRLKESDKYPELLKQLSHRQGAIIVFVKTKVAADKLSIQLTKANQNACAIHGDLRQQKRERVMQAFRKGNHRILVATDVAARGLDVPQVQHVINYDLPQASEDYIHRIGRTARNGATGSALNFISARDQKLWEDIQRLLNPETFQHKKNLPSSKKGPKKKRSASFSKKTSPSTEIKRKRSR